MKAIIKIFNI